MRYRYCRRGLALLMTLTVLLSIIAPASVLVGAEGSLEKIYSNDFSTGTVQTNVGQYVLAAQDYNPVVENGVLRLSKNGGDAYIGLRPDNEGHDEYKNGGSKSMNRDLTLSVRLYMNEAIHLGTLKCGDNEVSRNSLEFLAIGNGGLLWTTGISHTLSANAWHTIRVDFRYDNGAGRFTSYQVEVNGTVLGTVSLANGPAHINSFELFRWGTANASFMVDDVYLGFGAGIAGDSQGGGNQGGSGEVDPDTGREIIAVEDFEDKSINSSGADNAFTAQNVFFFGNNAGSKTEFVDEANGNTTLRYTHRALGDINDIRFFYSGQEAMREKLHQDFILSFRIKPLIPSLDLGLNWRGKNETDSWLSPVRLDSGRVSVNGKRYVDAELVCGKWSVIEVAFHYNESAESVGGETGAIESFDVIVNGRTIAENVTMEKKLHTLDYFRLFSYAIGEFELDDLTVAVGAETLARAGDYDDNSRVHFYSDKTPASDYAYSMAIVGDTQNIVRYTDVADGYVTALYDWLVANKDTKKIGYVMGLGDITNDDTTAEWDIASKHIRKLNGVIPYSLVRGNHDGSTNFNQYFANDPAYSNQFGGFFEAGSVENSWRALNIGGTDYLFITLDYGASDAALEWAGEIMEAHPQHRVIVTTHAYLYLDGTTVDDDDAVPPTSGGEDNNGDDMWEKLIRKHENIVLVISGHESCDEVVVSQVKGDHGNTVTQMLVDFQSVDVAYGAAGMVTMLYFSADGSMVEVETYSTVKRQYFLKENQFVMNLKLTQGNTGGIGMESVPYIGENGNWWIGDTDLGVKANGADGKNGADGQDGIDGLTPYIGENGNWWLGSSDTGIKAAAEPVAESKSGCKGAVASEALLLLLMLAAACVPTFKSKKRDSDLSVL